MGEELIDGELTAGALTCAGPKPAAPSEGRRSSALDGVPKREAPMRGARGRCARGGFSERAQIDGQEWLGERVQPSEQGHGNEARGLLRVR
jgi:hypothetical protein